MTGTVLERSLKMVARRLYKLRVLRRQALCWILLLVPAVVSAMLLPQAQGFLSTNLLVLLIATCVGIVLARWKVPAPTAIETARLVEQNRPELNDAVLTAVQADQRSRQQTQSSLLNAWVIDEADKLARKSNWSSIVPGRQMLAWSVMSLLAFCFLVAGVLPLPPVDFELVRSVRGQQLRLSDQLLHDDRQAIEWSNGGHERPNDRCIFQRA